VKLGTLDLHNSIYLEKEYQKEFSLPANEKTKFDSFHNSFFETYWLKYTTLRNYSLNLFLKGHCKINIIRNVNGTETTISSHKINADEFASQKIDLKIESFEGSRIYFQVDSTSYTIVSNNVYWSTTDQPKQEIKLAAIMCTFNKREYIYRNLEKLLSNNELSHKKVHFIVIDNASNLELKNSEKLSYYAQDNYGGSGGFTRGLIEARKKKHVHSLPLYG
jgi:galactofuranosylgalactofuranosylrhamnosyl-N-acetylglucosaminyl-diphospho-decaprenol beta-1,5/1,6-galactofuranosyltransferase